MVCEPYTTTDPKTGKVMHGIMCHRGKRKPKPCSKCGGAFSRLCDFELRARNGHAAAVTCDKPLCIACAISIGPNTDHCPDHGTSPAQGQLVLAR